MKLPDIKKELETQKIEAYFGVVGENTLHEKSKSFGNLARYKSSVHLLNLQKSNSITKNTALQNNEAYMLPQIRKSCFKFMLKDSARS